MQKCGNLWMADWRDENGVRKRKGFNMERSALAFQRRMRAEVKELKKAHAILGPTSSSCPFVTMPSSVVCYVFPMKIVLASSSPRRAEILRAAGFVFQVRSVPVDETRHQNESGENYVQRVAKAKATAAAAQMRDAGERAIVIAADTTVAVGGQILAKPANASDARRMLRLLSGKTHEVLTALAVVRLPDGAESLHTEKTCVELLPISEHEIESYIRTGEPFDKAGAYGIQGIAGRFVSRIEGCYFNVMGLPLSQVWRALRALGWEDPIGK
jgi:septum formation protein